MPNSEIDPFSPAGTVERFDDLSRGLSRRGWGKLAVWIGLVVVVLLPAVSFMVVFLTHR